MLQLGDAFIVRFETSGLKVLAFFRKLLDDTLEVPDLGREVEFSVLEHALVV